MREREEGEREGRETEKKRETEKGERDEGSETLEREKNVINK